MKVKYSKYIKPYLSAFILGPILMIIEVVGEVFMPDLLKRIINLKYYYCYNNYINFCKVFKNIFNLTFERCINRIERCINRINYLRNMFKDHIIFKIFFSSK